MASGKSLQVEVVSHEGRLWHGAAASVQFPTVDGGLGVSFQVTGGFASVDSDFVTVVADHATVAEQ